MKLESSILRKLTLNSDQQKESDDIELEELPGVEDIPLYHIGRGLWGDIRRRVPFYLADFADGLNNLKLGCEAFFLVTTISDSL